MAPSDARFEVFRDPTDTWVVWDCEREDFACLGPDELYGLVEAQARTVCDLLNQARRGARRDTKAGLAVIGHRPLPSAT